MNFSSAAYESGSESGLRKIHVIQGQYHVADDDVVLTTILGSCVAACIRDPALGIGGMNHFLLPGADGDEGLRYGVQHTDRPLDEIAGIANALIARGLAR